MNLDSERRPVRQVFVQPHFDDVALACGGAVAAHAAAGDPTLVVTVFSAGPARFRPLGALAKQLHAQWGTGTASAQVRSREDEEAADVLGADPIRLGFRDATYRAHRYGSWERLYGPPHRRDAPMPKRLASALLPLGMPEPTCWYFPLGRSGHVDHVLVRAAGDLLVQRGAEVSFYEDFGGSVDEAKDDSLGALTHGLQADDVDSTEWFSVKVQAVACYRSQLVGLFGSTDVAGALDASRDHERFWRPRR
jgi:LmbE family N-acetylglucosaminyl deacetylase